MKMKKKMLFTEASTEQLQGNFGKLPLRYYNPFDASTRKSTLILSRNSEGPVLRNMSSTGYSRVN
jgi:hypothetical protein